jgi:formate hydrogenlyase subunit 3/multisubunit Na+/H+ antiporter MnhD subunit
MSWLTLILGLFLGVAPWLLGYSDNSTALWTSVVLGTIIALVALYKVMIHDTAKWEYWVAGVAGFVAVFAPFVLGFTVEATAMWTTGVVGLVVFFVALYELFWSHRDDPMTR